MPSGQLIKERGWPLKFKKRTAEPKKSEPQNIE
jgi:hypothetical protein